MKNFISKNWKNFLLIIGVIFIVIDLFYIITKPATIPEDFLEYGPNVESDIFDNTSDLTSSQLPSGSTNEMIKDVSNSTGLPPELAKGLLLFTFGFIIILILSSLLDKNDKKKK